MYSSTFSRVLSARKFTLVISQLKKVAEGQDYSAVDVGPFADLQNYRLFDKRNGKYMMPGKVFVQDELKSKGCAISFTVLEPGKSDGFYHAHRTNEEHYIVVQGTGVFHLNHDVVPVSQGSVVRVGTSPFRMMENTGDCPLVYICVQNEMNQMKETPWTDGVAPEEGKYPIFQYPEQP